MIKLIYIINPSRSILMAKKIKIEGIDNRLIQTCPVCGYSFQPVEPKTKKKIKVCPMCGHKFIEPDMHPHNYDDFKKRIM